MDYSHHMTVDPDETAARARALLIDEAASKVKIEMDSKPEVMDISARIPYIDLQDNIFWQISG